MIKRIGVLMLSLLILMGCIGVSAADERVSIGEITVQTEEGVTTVTAQLLTKPEGKSAVLVAAYMDPDSGKILSVNVHSCEDVSLLDGSELSVTLDDKTEEGGVLSTIEDEKEFDAVKKDLVPTPDWKLCIRKTNRHIPEIPPLVSLGHILFQ